MYKIGVLWRASGKGNYTPMFQGGQVDTSGRWMPLTEEWTGEASARVDLKLVTRGLANESTIDPTRYDIGHFYDEQGNRTNREGKPV